MSNDSAKRRANFRRSLKRRLDEIDKELEGQYKSELEDLLGLSKVDVDAVTPDGTDLVVYAKLIAVVKESSRRNVSQAELKERILSLGETAVEIAGKVNGLAALFI